MIASFRNMLLWGHQQGAGGGGGGTHHEREGGPQVEMGTAATSGYRGSRHGT